MDLYDALTAQLFTETEVLDGEGNVIGVEKRWTNDTNQPVEFNPPGLVCAPGDGLFINTLGTVALVHPEVDEHPPPNGIHVPPAVRVTGAKAPVRAVATVKKKLKKIHVVPRARFSSSPKSDDASFKPKRKK